MVKSGASTRYVTLRMMLMALLVLQLMPLAAFAEEPEDALAPTEQLAQGLEEDSSTEEAAPPQAEEVSADEGLLGQEDVEAGESIDDVDMEEQAGGYSIIGATSVLAGAKATYSIPAGTKLALKSGKDYAKLSGNTLQGVMDGTVVLSLRDSSGKERTTLKVEIDDSVYETEYVIRSALDTSYVLDVSGGSLSKGANVQLYRANGTSAQVWSLNTEADDAYNTVFGIYSCHALWARCLDVAGGSTSNGANVRQWTHNGSAAQQWDMYVDAQQMVTFVNRKSGKALDVAGGKVGNGRNVRQYSRNDSLAQKWVLEPFTGEVVAEGFFRLAASGNTKYVLDVAGGSKANGANIRLWKSNGSKAQLWKISQLERFDRTCYRITNVGSGKVLEVAGGSTANGANVRQWTWNGTAAQLWEYGDGGRSADGKGETLSLINVKSGMALDLAGGKVANGSNIRQWRYNYSNAQFFTQYEIL